LPLDSSSLKSPNIETISFADFQRSVNPDRLGKLTTLLANYTNSEHSINIKDSSATGLLILNIDSAKKIQVDGYTSYVFTIKASTPRSMAFRNLTIVQGINGTKAYITTYLPTREWIDAWRSGRYIDFKGNVQLSSVDLNSLNIKKMNVNEIQQLSCINLTVWVPVGMPCVGNPNIDGPQGRHYPGQPCPLDGQPGGPYIAYNATTVTECEEVPSPPPSDGGGGGGTTPDPGDYDPCEGPTVSSIGNSISGLPPTPCDEPDPNEPQPIPGYVPGEASSEANLINSNVDPDRYWWDDIYSTFPQQQLPSYATFWANYPKKTNSSNEEMDAPAVFSLVGGNVKAIYDSDPIANGNACALRVSRALNYSGVVIPEILDHTYKGADNKFYFLSAAKLYNWMKKTFGTGSVVLSSLDGGPNGSLFQSKLSGKKGIYIMQPNYPGKQYFGASGHASLFNGTTCMSDHCYFFARGGVFKITLWILN